MADSSSRSSDEGVSSSPDPKNRDRKRAIAFMVYQSSSGKVLCTKHRLGFGFLGKVLEQALMFLATELLRPWPSAKWCRPRADEKQIGESGRVGRFQEV
jgi:hypothetical protein